MPQLTRGQVIAATKGNIQLQQMSLAMYDQLQVLGEAAGIPTLHPVNNSQQPASAVPSTGGLSVTGANGSFAIAATNPTQAVNKTLYIEYSYSSQSNFASGATALPVSTATALNYSAPGVSAFWRARWSYDQRNWSNYAYVSGIVSSGLQSSAATSNATALNITNYAQVDAVPNGLGSQNVRVYGASGPGTGFPTVKGVSEAILPPATIINSTLGSKPYVAYDPDTESYVVRSTLPQVFADNLIPIGQVGAPEGGSVVLPVITANLGGGGIASYTVVSGGSDLSAAVDLDITDPTGSGAVPGPQTIVGGVLTAVGDGLPGALYTAPVVGVSGGRAPAQPGGGTVTGNNGGRLTAIQGNG